MRSKRDAKHIQQYEHDEASNAKRVKLTDTEISIELDHNDGDSVTAHPANLVASALGVTNVDDEVIPPQDCKSLKKCKVYLKVNSGSTNGTIKVQVSPVDSGEVWYDLAELSAQNGVSTTLELVARRVKVIQGNSLDSADIDVHFVGQ